jgi:hypothetical protein
VENSAELRKHALARAVQVTGSTDNLSSLIGCSPGKLHFMLEGLVDVPDYVFLEVVDILADPAIDAGGAVGSTRC